MNTKRKRSHKREKVERERERGRDQLVFFSSLLFFRAMKASGRMSEASPGRGGSANHGASVNTSTDLLVCFPSRAHLVLAHKPICSLARPVGHLSRGHAPPLFPTKPQTSSTRRTGDHKVADVAEPTSPKVTCAGQIKTKPKRRDRAGSRNRQSVMEEMEKIHAGTRRDSWLKRVMRLDGRGLQGFFHGSSEEQCEESGTIFSKWLMILQENDVGKEAMVRRDEGRDLSDHHNIQIMESSVPPKNALVLMRRRRSSTSSKQVLL